MKGLGRSVLRLGAKVAPLLALALALASCDSSPLPATPAIWHVTSNTGQEGWLFGTIHAAPKPVAWRSQALDEALSRSGVVVVEVANIADDAAVSQAFATLSRTPSLPPVEQRVAAKHRGRLMTMIADRRLKPSDLRDVETWAIALTLARPAKGSDAANGIDRAVLAAASGKPVVELEGATGQLSIFDRLPEAEQRDLLNFVLSDVAALDDDASLLDIWRKGDMKPIEAETRSGMLADPELREALFTGRNRKWIPQIERDIRDGRRPFVAVGAAHMVGHDGLVVMLQRAGYTVTRLQ